MLDHLLVPERVVSDYSDEQVCVGIKEGKICGRFPANAEARHTVDLAGCSLLPGFIDLHIHFGAEVSPAIYARLLEPRVEKIIRSVVDARSLLAAGFTTARDVGGRCAIALRNCIDAGEVPGPKLYCAGRGLTSTGGAEDWSYLPVEEVNRLSDGVQIADGVAACQKAVRDQYRLGADWIKMFVNGFYTEQRYSREEVIAAVDEATRLGLPVAVHGNGGAIVKDIIQAGCRTIEHGTYLDEDTCRLMKEHGVFLVPTLSFTKRYAEEGPSAGISTDDPQNDPDRLTRRYESVKMAKAAGVKIATGTDFGYRSFLRHGRNNADEMSLLVEAGLSPMEALMAGTKHAAEALGQESRIGTIREGSTADVVAVRGNPLDCIDAVRDVEFVMKGGEVVVEASTEAIGRSEVHDRRTVVAK